MLSLYPWLHKKNVFLTTKNPCEPSTPASLTPSAQHFIETLHAQTISALGGQPIESFEPWRKYDIRGIFSITDSLTAL